VNDFAKTVHDGLALPYARSPIIIRRPEMRKNSGGCKPAPAVPEPEEVADRAANFANCAKLGALSPCKVRTENAVMVIRHNMWDFMNSCTRKVGEGNQLWRRQLEFSCHYTGATNQGVHRSRDVRVSFT
jgi:hypothetical protein